MFNSMLIIKYIRSNKISKELFCELCQIEVAELDLMIYLGKYDNKTLEKIANIIGVGYYEFFSC